MTSLTIACRLRTAVIFLLIAFAGHAVQVRAGVIAIALPQSAYTSGQPFEVGLQMPGITDLFAYEISLHLTSDSGIAGQDYFLWGATPAPANYLFASTANFAATAVVDSNSLSRMTISDIDDALGTDIVSGVNDQLATVQIMTSLNFSGTLKLSIDLNGLFLDDISLTPVQEYDSILSDTLAAGTTRIPANSIATVPEPSSSAIMLTAFAVITIAKSRRVTRSRRREA